MPFPYFLQRTIIKVIYVYVYFNIHGSHHKNYTKIYTPKQDLDDVSSPEKARKQNRGRSTRRNK